MIKNKTFLLIFISSLFLLFAPFSIQVKAATDLDMSKFEPTPVFAEEFEGDELNEDIWQYSTNSKDMSVIYAGHSWHGKALSLYNGSLHMNVAYYPEGINGGIPGWYAPNIRTTDKFEYKYGYIEARCKMPVGTGISGAFWINSSNMNHGKAECLDGLGGAEVDIVEAYMLSNARADSVAQNVFTNGYGNDMLNLGATYAPTDSNPYENFHTYGFEWGPDKYVFYIDGKKTKELVNSPENKIVASQSFEYILLTIGNAGSNSVPQYGMSSVGTTFNNSGYDFAHGNENWEKYESDFVIDYIRLYQYKDTENIQCEIKGTGVDSLPEVNGNQSEDRDYPEADGNEGPLSYIKSENEITIIGCENNAEGEIIIPEEIDGLPVTAVADYAFENCSKITAVTVPDNVKSLGNYAFSHCTKLKNITLSEQLEEIGSYCFSNCVSLKSIEIPNSVSKIGKYAFESCEKLKSVVIPQGISKIEEETFSCFTSLISVVIPSSVSEISSRAFFNCTSLADILMPDSITEIGGEAFYNCINLKAIYIPDATESIGEGAFKNCKSVTQLVIPDGIQIIEKFTFSNCENLVALSIPASVKKIENNAFFKCYNLRSINLPNEITEIGNSTFELCESLESITIPKSVSKIGDYAFRGCASLGEINLSDNIISIGKRAFFGCDELKEITVPGSVTELGVAPFGSCKRLERILVDSSSSSFASKDGVLYTYDLKKLIQYPSGKADAVFNIPEGVTNIAESSFSGSPLLLKVIMPNTVREMGFLSFSNCANLNEVVFTENFWCVRTQQFVNCPNLTFVKLPDKIRLLAYNGLGFCPSMKVLISEVSEDGKFESSSNSNTNFDHAFFAASSTKTKFNATTVHYNATSDDYEITEFKNPTREEKGRVVIHCNICDKDIISELSPIAETHNVKLDLNGGECETSSLQVTNNLSYGRLPVPTRENYEFVGWYTTRNGGSRVTSGTVVDLEKDITLYARWTGKVVKVSFDSDNCDYSCKVGIYGENYGVLPVTEGDRNNTAWYSEKADGYEIREDAKIVNSKNHSIYNVDGEIGGIVSFDLNYNGSGDAPNPITVTIGEPYGTLPIPAAPTGYTFGGWYTDKENGSVIVADTIADFNKVQKLYAHWEPKSCFAYLDYNLDGVGTNLVGIPAGTHSVGDYTYSYDPETCIITVNGSIENITSEVLFSSPIQVKEGEKYAVSYEYISGGAQYAVLQIQIYGIGQFLRTYRNFDGSAVWTVTAAQEKRTTELIMKVIRSEYYDVGKHASHKFRVKFEKLEDGNEKATEFTSPALTLKYNEKIAYLPTPEKEGLRFIGWYTEKDGGEKVTTETVNTNLNDITLYAHWESEHNYISETTKEASCIQEGEITYTCSNCGDSYTESIEKTDHSYKEVVVSSTCLDDGYTIYNCSVCGNSYNDSTTKALGHDFSVLKSKKVEASCSKEGKEAVYKCSRCEAEKGGAVISKTAHSYTTTRTEPTCTNEGAEKTYCSNCGSIKSTTIIKATGHSDANGDNICDNCGTNLSTSDPSKNCSCNCHKSGFSAFIYKIQRFFWKIFKTHQVCGCGVYHY